MNIGNCVLTDDAETNKFIIPPGDDSGARFVSFNENTLGFALNAAGESIFFKDATLTRLLTRVQFAAQENGISTGRSPDGSGQFYRLAAKTPGTNNAALLVSDVVINELMYHPISGNADDQYVELFNRSAVRSNLGGWTLDDGIDFTFPTNTVISASGYLVVANNARVSSRTYPAVNPVPCSVISAANSRAVANGGADQAGYNCQHQQSRVVTTNLIDIAVDEVTYRTARSVWSDGGGSSPN